MSSYFSGDLRFMSLKRKFTGECEHHKRTADYSYIYIYIEFTYPSWVGLLSLLKENRVGVTIKKCPLFREKYPLLKLSNEQIKYSVINLN